MTTISKFASRLGTQTRSKKAKRNGHKVNPRLPLFESYSPKARDDVRFGELGQFVHFLCCEGEPTFQQIDYCNRHFWPDGNKEEDVAGLIASVTDGSGKVQILILGDELTRSKSDIAKHTFYLERSIDHFSTSTNVEPTVSLAFSTVLELKKKYETRIRNWFEIIPWIAQVRNQPLASHVRVIQELLRLETCVSAGTLRQIEKEDIKLSGLLLAAAFKGAGCGLWASDLDSRPISTRTMFGKVTGDVQ